MLASPDLPAASASAPLRVGVVDDHLLFRKGIIAILRAFDDFQLVLEAADGQQLIDQLQEAAREVDVLLLDLEMPHVDGLAATRWVQANRPEVRVLILSMHGDESLIINLLQEGADGYLFKNAHPDEVATAIRQVAQQGFYFSDTVARLMQRHLQGRHQNQQAARRLGADLSEPEYDVLRLVVKGLTSQQIGEQLHVSPRTVEGRRRRIQEKLGVRSTAELVHLAVREGLV